MFRVKLAFGPNSWLFKTLSLKYWVGAQIPNSWLFLEIHELENYWNFFSKSQNSEESARKSPSSEKYPTKSRTPKGNPENHQTSNENLENHPNMDKPLALDFGSSQDAETDW